MIRYLDVLDAVNRVNGHRRDNIDSVLVSQLARSLQVYKDRGEFDGTMDSAYKCLEQAEYETEPLAPMRGLAPSEGER